MKVQIEVTKSQAALIMHCLDLYSRIAIGQFDIIKKHWAIEEMIWENHRDEFIDFADEELLALRNKIFNFDSSMNHSYGIHHYKVNDTAREAFDILQVIRHELWKQNPDRSMMTVDSSVHFTSKNKEVNEVKVKII